MEDITQKYDSHLNLPQRIHLSSFDMVMIKMGYNNPGWVFRQDLQQTVFKIKKSDSPQAV